MKIGKGLLIFAICISLTGCGKENEEVKINAKEIGTIIESGNIEDINNLIFGIDKLEVIGGLEEIIGNQEIDTENKGILSDIFQRNTIKVRNVSDNMIEYEIEAPDLKELFLEILNKKEVLSQEQFLSYMKEYVTKAKLKKVTVEVPYTMENEKVIIDYQNQEFIDGITGGLLSAYQQLYEDMINEYMKEMENN